MAFAGAEVAQPAASTPAWRRWPLDAYRELAAKLEAYPLERIGVAAMVAGLVLRLAAPFFMDFRADGDTYTAMGHAWMLHREFLMPYGDVATWGPLPPGHSNHYPPAYPFYLGVVFSIFGFGLWQAKWAAVVMSIAAIVAVYACTRDLYGRVPAALTAGLIALEPHFLWTTGTGFSENMVLLFFTITMWAILRSLTDDRYILLAGLFAGLAYLSRSSVGYFFVVAGGAGFLWRFYWRRWRLFTNVWYLGAIAIFLAIVGAWAYRNASLFPPVTQYLTVFGHTWRLTLPAWETSSYVRYAQTYAFERPELWWDALRRKVPYFILFLAWWALPFLPESWRATKRIREEHTSALWLSVFLVWLIAWIISGMFTVLEKVDFISNNHRYVIIGLVPLAWLIFREAKLERASTRLRVVVMALALFLASGAVFTNPIRYPDLRAAEFMDDHLRPGDEVAVDGSTIKYAFYAYLTRPEAIRIYGCEDPDPAGARSGPCFGEPDIHGNRADFVLTLQNASYPGYEWVGDFRQYYWDGGQITATLYARADIAADRDIPTGFLREYR